VKSKKRLTSVDAALARDSKHRKVAAWLDCFSAGVMRRVLSLLCCAKSERESEAAHLATKISSMQTGKRSVMRSSSSYTSFRTLSCEQSQHRERSLCSQAVLLHYTSFRTLSCEQSQHRERSLCSQAVLLHCLLVLGCTMPLSAQHARSEAAIELLSANKQL
jgi:hypothetical protein